MRGIDIYVGANITNILVIRVVDFLAFNPVFAWVPET